MAEASRQRGPRPPDSTVGERNCINWPRLPGPDSQLTHPAGQHTERPLMQVHDGVVLALVPVHFLGPVSLAQLEDLK